MLQWYVVDGSRLAGDGVFHFVLVVLVDVLGLVEVASDGVDDEEEEGQDQDGQYYVHCHFTYIPHPLLSSITYII
jgi:hypothetical protein